MKVFSFCLKKGDERRTAVRDLVGLTECNRRAHPGGRGTAEESEGRGCSCLTGLGEGGETKVYVEHGSVPVFIKGWKVSRSGCGGWCVCSRQAFVGSPVAV